MLSYGGLRPSEVVHLTIPDPAEQAPLVARSVTPPSPSGRGGTTLLRQRAPRSCTVFVMTPPDEHTSEGGRDDRGVPYHAESTLSSAQVLKCWVGLWFGWVVPREVGSSARRVRSRPPPLTPADGHCRCFWLRHRPKRAQCARRHRASSPLRGAACCADGFLWLSSRAFCVPAGGRACVV